MELNPGKLLQICHSIPKTELHAHLNGSIRKSTLIELLSYDDKEEISKLFQNQMSFENAFRVFKISSKIVTSLDIIKRITREMIEDWSIQNCIYLEIRTSIKSIGGCSKEDYLKTVLQQINESNGIFEMQTRLIISLNRELSLEEFQETMDMYKNFKDISLKKLIVGIDYSGNENNEKHSYKELIPIFEKFRELGLKITIHMGEIRNYQLLDYSLFKPDRISHTFFFKENEYEEIMRNKIPIEICPTGSYSIQNLHSYKKINFSNYYKKIVKKDSEEFVYDLYCINTDDTMLFNTDLSQEYLEIALNFQINGEEMKQIILKTIDFIFESDEVFRNNLRTKINNFSI